MSPLKADSKKRVTTWIRRLIYWKSVVASVSTDFPDDDEGGEADVQGNVINSREESNVSTNPAKERGNRQEGRKNLEETWEPLVRSPLAAREGRIYCLCWKIRPGKPEPLGRVHDVPSVMGKFLSFFPTLESKRPMENPDWSVGMTDIEPYTCLTVYEYLEFVGRLHNMTKSLIHERILYLSEILELPSGHSPLGRLHVGDHSRVALAAALVHSPSLLILNVRLVEQGTSYRERVWKFLRRLKREEGLLILVITPDFREAREADEDACCWLPDCQPIDPDQYSPLRQCRELSRLPHNFRYAHQMDPSGRRCYSSENSNEANSALTCTKDAGEKVTAASKDGSRTEYASAATMASDRVIKRSVPLKTLTSSWHRILMLVTNDLIEFRRFRHVLLWALWIFSIVVFMCISGAYRSKPSKPPRLPVAVVQSNTTSSLAEPFLASLRMRLEDDSIRYETVFKREPYVNLDEALASVESGDTCGVLRIGENLSTLAQYRILLRTNNGNYVEESTLDINVEATDQETRFWLQKAINVSLWALRQKISDGRNASSTESTLKFTIVDDPVFGSRWINYLEFHLPLFFMVSLYVIGIVMTVAETNLNIERFMARNFWALGITRFERAFATFCFILCILVSQLILVLVCMLLLNFLDLLPLKGSLTLVAALILMLSFKGMTIGLLIASLVTFIDNFFNRYGSSISVGLWPLALIIESYAALPGFPRHDQIFGRNFAPRRYVEALRYILYRGCGIERDEIQTAFKTIVRDSQIFLLLSAALIIFVFIRRRSASSVQTRKGQLYRKRLHALTERVGAAVFVIGKKILRVIQGQKRAKDATECGLI